MIKMMRKLFLLVLLLAATACTSQEERLQANAVYTRMLHTYGAEFATLDTALPKAWLIAALDTGTTDTTAEAQHSTLPTNTVTIIFAPKNADGHCNDNVQFRFYAAAHEASIRAFISRYMHLHANVPPALPESWHNEKYFLNIFPNECNIAPKRDTLYAQLVSAVVTHFGLQEALPITVPQ